MFIYVITNKINGKKYVGQTVQTVQKRFKRHCWESTLEAAAMPISLAIKKYGKDNFTIETIAQCSTQKELDEAEIHFAKSLNTFSPNGYNLKAGAGPGAMSEETRKKISIANTGKKASEETKEKLSKAHMGFKVSDATKEKLSNYWKGKRASDLCYTNSAKANSKTYLLIDPEGKEKTITNMAQFCRENNLNKHKMCEVIKGRQTEHKGWRASPQDLNKHSDRKHSDATKEKLSTINIGKKRSAESRQKQSQYWIGKKRGRRQNKKLKGDL